MAAERNEAAILWLLAPLALTVALSAVDRLDADDMQQIILVESIRDFVLTGGDSDKDACSSQGREVGVSDHPRFPIGELNTKGLKRRLMQYFV